jgi:hypothetical protein
MLSSSSSSSSFECFLTPTFRRKTTQKREKVYEEVKERSSTDSERNIFFCKKINSETRFPYSATVNEELAHKFEYK